MESFLSSRNTLGNLQPFLPAGVVQWQNVSFPSLKYGFDSRHPYQPDSITIRWVDR
jgi:hypothetical protein